MSLELTLSFLGALKIPARPCCHGHLIREYLMRYVKQIWMISNITAGSAKDKCKVHSHESPQITGGMRSDAWVCVEEELAYRGVFAIWAQFEQFPS